MSMRAGAGGRSTCGLGQWGTPYGGERSNTGPELMPQYSLASAGCTLSAWVQWQEPISLWGHARDGERVSVAAAEGLTVER